MIRNIRLHWTDNTAEHDDSVSESTMRSLCPTFFRAKHGKRETYSFYKGFVITRYTSYATGERVTVLYIFFKKLENRADFLCIHHPGSVRSAKKLADDILENNRIPHKELIS